MEQKFEREDELLRYFIRLQNQHDSELEFTYQGGHVDYNEYKKLKGEILLALEILYRVREKKEWSKVWKGTDTENGRIHQFCRDLLHFEREV